MIDKNKLYSKTTLYAVGKTKEARFMLNDYKHALKLTVFERDLSNKKAKAKLGCNLFIRRDTLYALLDMMKELPKQKEDYIFTVKLHTPVWVDDKPTGDMKESGSVSLVRKKKDEDIVNYLIISDNKVGSKYIFKLAPTPYYTFMVNNKVVSEEEASNIFVKAYAKTLESILNVVPEAWSETSDLTTMNNDTKPLTTDVKPSTTPKDTVTSDSIDDLLNDL